MSSDSQEATGSPLSDEQRLILLEKSRRLDRIGLLAMATVLAVTLASWLTWGLMSHFGGKEEQVIGNSEVEAVQKQQAALENQVKALQLQLTRLDALARSKPSVAVPNGANHESLEQLARIMITQEQGFQHGLAALKRGMRDLAGMIAGSRSWLDDYNETLDRSLAESRARENQLQQWLAGDD